MTGPSSCVSLGDGSSAEAAATAAAMHPSPPDKPPRGANLAHQAALRRLHGVSSTPRRVSEAIDTPSPSSAAIEPVLVRSYNNPTPAGDPSRNVKMRNKGRSRVDKSCELPPLERFSFQDILASIDSDVKGSIDAIAEICGRSRMSLADQYGSHLPPQGELTALLEHGQVPGSQSEDHVSGQELPSTFQLTRDHTQVHDRRHSASLGLVGNLHPRGSITSSAPVIATSNINFQPIPNSYMSEHLDPANASADSSQSAPLPYVLSWLRRSSASLTAGGHESLINDGDHNSAADVLQRILRRTGEPPASASVN